MNNTELLKKISKKSGAPETESAAFFEHLVKKISKVLKDDEIIKLNDIGFFKIVNKDQNKIITFSQSQKFDEEKSIFYLVNNSDQASDPVDSFFSISLDKPEIPTEEHIEEFFVPPAGYELRSFMESKADDLLLESKIIKADAEVEENISEADEKIEDQIIEAPEIKYDEKIQIESDEDFIKNESKDDFIEDRVEDTESEKEKFFSEDIVEKTFDEIEEEKSSEAEYEAFSNEELQEIKEDFFKNDVSSEIELEDYKFSGIENIEEDVEEVEKENNESDKFQKVTSLLSKIPADLDEAADLNYDSEKKYLENPSEEELDEKGFSKVKFNRIKPIDEELKKENSGDLKEYELIDKSILEEDADIEKSLAEGLNEKTADIYSTKKINEIKEKFKSGKPNRKIILVPIILLVLIGAGFLIYTFLQNNNNGETVIKEAAFQPSDPKIIERNYEIPVNYPYEKGNDLLFNAVDPSVYSSAEPVQKTESVNKEPENNQTAQNNISQSMTDLENAEPIPAENYQEIKNYIYSDGKIYFIQVASWNSLARAERHNSNLLKKGYNSSIEKLISPKGKIYYIVRLGSFNSLQEAEKYLKNN